MDQNQIIEGNKLLADFMGVKIGVDMYSWRPGVYNPITEENLNYHASWGWLMQVVEKISRIEFERRYDEGEERWVIWTHHPVTFGMLSPEGKPMVRFYCNALHIADTLIEAAYLACVDFIKWHNDNKQS